jgi:4-amino-4-deoxy-L-arabinose transferase-like glycosyltransferase
MALPPLSFISMRATETSERARRAAYGVLAIAIAMRLLAAALVPLAPDETYYWEWSRRLAAGYLDHPPLVAFAIRLGTLLLGATPLGVRLGSVLAGALASLILVRIAGALGGDRAMLRAAAIIACLPLAQIGLGLATPDAALMLFWTLALAALVAALRDDAAPGARMAAWVAFGIAIGAALFAKYTAVLLVIGTGTALAALPSARRALATPGPYLAMALALLVFAPNLAWNAQHGWVSFDYQLAHGLAVHRGSALLHELQLLGGQIALVSPLLLAALAIPAVRAMRARDDETRTAFAIVAAVTWLAFVASALRSAAEPNWQAPAYLSTIVLAATYDGDARWRTLLRAACALGAALTLLIYAHAIVPFVPANIALDPTAAGFGWDSLAAHVDSARHARIDAGATTWVGGERYQEASELAFHLADHPVTFAIDVHGRPTQYDLWPLFPQRAHRGDRLVLVLGLYMLAENDPVIAALRPHFGKITLREVVPLRRGNIVRAYRRIWVLDAWDGTWPSSDPAH